MKISAKKIIFSIISASVGIICIAIAIMLLFYVGKKGYNFGNAVFDEQPVSQGLGKDVIVDIDKDMTDKTVASYMKKMGLVEDSNVFYTQITLSDYKGKYVAGRYKLNTNMKPTEILKTICSGEFYVDPSSVIEETTGEAQENETDTTEPAESEN